ncbi:hypothetical protein [Persicobacter diffluens]|uniref:Calcineurin-like phosphoesterase domain-containing protein n=1 Tax=Persicobacter diffluens TaxID=981 RepID=A0AAN5APM2_9BACT|nr:hypothetical protein PEDI_45400 [Persicobacter diffluens]
MLVIISDLHLVDIPKTDNPTVQNIPPYTFKIFRERLREMAYEASWRTDGSYQPIAEMDLLLLGDILDIIRSSKWLNSDTLRPWSDPYSPEFIDRIAEINQAILKENKEALDILKGLNSGDLKKMVTLPPAESDGRVAKVGYEPDAPGRVPVKVNIHYMVGNHDWFYHLPGVAYNNIRQSVISAMGLVNSPNEIFPHDPKESPLLYSVMKKHQVLARHGDIYDGFNFEGNRNASSLGDAIVIDLLNKFPKRIKKQIPDSPYKKEFLAGLQQMDNVRPLLMIPSWIDSLLQQHYQVNTTFVDQVKGIWNSLADEFLDLDFVKERDNVWNPVDKVDQLQIVLKLADKLSFSTISKVVQIINKRSKQKGESYADYALKEEAYAEAWSFIVYGHTHHAEVVPLGRIRNKTQIYLNSGSWRTIHELAKDQSHGNVFIPNKEMTYLAFYEGTERAGRKFERWTGNLEEVRNNN